MGWLCKGLRILFCLIIVLVMLFEVESWMEVEMNGNIWFIIDWFLVVNFKIVEVVECDGKRERRGFFERGWCLLVVG